MHRLSTFKQVGNAVGQGHEDKGGSSDDLSNSEMAYGPDAMFGSASEVGSTTTDVVRLGSTASRSRMGSMTGSMASGGSSSMRAKMSSRFQDRIRR